MANSNDSSGKGPAKPGTDASAKKPAALIDLKPTEVDIRDPQQNASRPQTAVAGASANPTASSPPAGGPATGGTAAGGAPGVAAEAAAKAASAGPAATGSKPITAPAGGPARPGATASTAPPAARPASSGGGLRGASTHLAAGLAGGLLALLGVDALAPNLGLSGAGPGTATQELGARLQILEQAGQRPPASELSQKLTAAEARLAQLEQTSGAIDTLTRQHAALAGETKALGEKLVQAPADANVEARVAKLEETLSALATLAQTDPQPGRIPQLVAVTGRLADLESSLTTQIAALRRSVTQEVDSRLTQSTEASQAARAGTQRLDRELAGVRTESAQLTQSVDGLKAQSDRVEIAVRGLREDATALKADIGTVREELSREMKQVARPTDVTSARLELERARVELRRLRAGPSLAAREAARQAVDAANARLRQLLSPPLASDVKSARLDIRRADAELAVLRARRGPASATDIALAQLKVDTAKARLSRALAAAGPLTVRAPRAGTVTALLTTVGARVDPTTPVVAMADLDRLEVRVDLSEFDIAMVKQGQKATVSVDALGGESFPGEVLFAALTGTNTGGVVTFPVQVGLTDAPGLKPGMNVSVRIIVANRQNVVQVPLEFVTQDGGEATVMVLDASGQPVARQVKLGLANNKYVEIVKGLRAGERVVLEEPGGGGGA